MYVYDLPGAGKGDTCEEPKRPTKKQTGDMCEGLTDTHALFYIVTFYSKYTRAQTLSLLYTLLNSDVIQ
jgi:hypothetical protein